MKNNVEDELIEKVSIAIKYPDKKRWVALGIYFGYPACCIEDFCKDTTITTKQKDLCKDGFIPCPDCCEKITSRVQLKDLITNRICKTPFPINE